MNVSDQPGRGAEAPQERLSSLIEAIRRIGASLDIATVLREVVDSARALTGARYVEHRLGDEGARQRRAVLLRTPYLAAEVGEKSLNPHQFKDRDEELVALAHRAKLALQPREQFLLKREPIVR